MAMVVRCREEGVEREVEEQLSSGQFAREPGPGSRACQRNRVILGERTRPLADDIHTLRNKLDRMVDDEPSALEPATLPLQSDGLAVVPLTSTSAISLRCSPIG